MGVSVSARNRFFFYFGCKLLKDPDTTLKAIWQCFIFGPVLKKATYLTAHFKTSVPAENSYFNQLYAIKKRGSKDIEALNLWNVWPVRWRRSIVSSTSVVFLLSSSKHILIKLLLFQVRTIPRPIRKPQCNHLRERGAVIDPCELFCTEAFLSFYGSHSAGWSNFYFHSNSREHDNEHDLSKN